MGWVGGGGSGSPREALGWRSGPPEQDKSLLHEGKNWAERLMEARNFEGKKSFLETRNREEAYQPQLLFKELFPAPPTFPPKTQQPKNHCYLIVVPSFPQHSSWLLHPSTCSHPKPFPQTLYPSVCQSVGSTLKADPESSYTSRLPRWAKTPVLSPGLPRGGRGSPHCSFNFYLCLFSVCSQ